MKNDNTQNKLNHDTIVQLEKMATLGNLAAGVAHEINTPMSALKSNIDILKRLHSRLNQILFDAEAPEEIRNNEELVSLCKEIESLGEINQTAIDRITAIADGLRNFSRVDKDEKLDFNVADGLESTLKLVSHKLKDKIHITTKFDYFPVIKAFPNLLNQLFLNIVINAIQAIDDSGEITIHLFSENNFVVIKFQDTGQGISKENLDKIFEPGFTTKGPSMGTGLGLSIVQKILHKHDGKLTVQSEVGRGSIFTIYLPFK